MQYAGTDGYGQLKQAEKLQGDETGREHHSGAGEQLHTHLAEDLGVSAVPFAKRLNVGFEHDDTHRYIEPEADFACWGWMQKKGGIRKHWQERFVELDSSCVLRYFADSNDKPVKRGGSTKTLLCGYEQKGEINMAAASEIRMSTAPGAEAGEIEIVTPNRIYRMIPGRTSPGTKRIADKVEAGQQWCFCLNMAHLAALGQAAGMRTDGPELRASIQAASSHESSAGGETEDDLSTAVAMTQRAAQDLGALA
eukprot:COSAG02_NODE_3129_length_7312_cov_338.294191_5_plen_252_part_00